MLYYQRQAWLILRHLWQVPWIPDLYGAPKTGKEGEIKEEEREKERKNKEIDSLERP